MNLTEKFMSSPEIKSFARSNHEKIIVDTVVKLQNAKIELQRALDCLLGIKRGAE